MIAIEVSEEANKDLDGIYDYGAEHFGVEAADAYLGRFNTVYDLIRSFPLSGAVHDTVRPPIRSLPCGEHRLYYDVTEDRAIVRRVLHQAMNGDWYL